MKTLKTLINEKILINKDTHITEDPKNRLTYYGIIEDIMSKTKLRQDEVENMLSYCNTNINQYKFVYLDINENYNKFGYKVMFDLCADLLNHPRKKEHLTERIYINKVIDVWAYLHKNINLSSDGTEYYIFIIDHINDIFYVYEILDKDGNNWIKKFD